MSIPKEISHGIVVKKDGLFRYYWDSGQQIKKIDSMLMWLHYPLYLDDNITFEDFFNHVMNDVELASIIFYSHLGGYSLSDWVGEWNKPDPGDEKYTNQQIDHIEIYWVAEYWITKKDKQMDENVGLHGVGRSKDKDCHGDNEWHNTNFSFSFTPINEFKHYLFKLNTDWKLLDQNCTIPLSYSQNKDQLLMSKNMTVYDVVGCILDDLSFYGDPSERQDIG